MTETPAIYVQGEGSYWLAHVPVLRGCIASGTTRDEAIANARRAFRAYLDLLDARGVSVEHWKDLDPKTFDVRVVDLRHGQPIRVMVDETERTIRADCGQKVWVRA